MCLHVAEPDEVPIFVDELHPEVQSIVEDTMANVKFEDADLPVTNIAINTLMEAVGTAEEERLRKLPSASRSVIATRCLQLLERLKILEISWNLVDAPEKLCN